MKRREVSIRGLKEGKNKSWVTNEGEAIERKQNNGGGREGKKREMLDRQGVGKSAYTT